MGLAAVKKVAVVFSIQKVLNIKNVVLLCCERCYGYKSGVSGTQHEQFLQYYYKIYGNSKSVLFVSGFNQKDNDNLSFANSSMNMGEPYGTENREMNEVEQAAITAVVERKLTSYDCC
ncbi:unnamed protein product [Rotaria sordida]|uniref:Uncharacterized protein n=1 Tax=Rotaria sordida TaxID=392033 RepID=A0A815JV35_9BILA|nr:unnamed protein product [Rotaria sordida]CAF3865828.1 unnamed protein product [Rotaria sordida]